MSKDSTNARVAHFKPNHEGAVKDMDAKGSKVLQSKVSVKQQSDATRPLSKVDGTEDTTETPISLLEHASASASATTSDSDESMATQVKKGKIRIGENYQCVVPDRMPLSDDRLRKDLRVNQTHHSDGCVFDRNRLPSDTVDAYLQVCQKFIREDGDHELSYEVEPRALEYLANHKYDARRALYTLLALHGVGQDEIITKHVLEGDICRPFIRGPDGWRNAALYTTDQPKSRRRNKATGVIRPAIKSWEEWLSTSKKIVRKPSASTGCSLDDLNWLKNQADELDKAFPRVSSCTDGIGQSIAMRLSILTEQVSAAKVWVSSCRDLMADESWNDKKIEDASLKLQEAKTSLCVDLMEQQVLEEVLRDLIHWKNQADAAIREKTSMSTIRHLINESIRMKLSSSLRNQLEEKLRSCINVEEQIKTIASHDKKRRKTSSTSIKDIQTLLADIEASGVEVAGTDTMNDIILRAEEWKRRSMDLLSRRSSLQEVKNMIVEAEFIPVDLSELVEPLKAKVTEAKNWLFRVRKTLPRQNKTRRGAGGGATGSSEKLELTQMQSILLDAPVEDDNEDVQHMQDVVESAHDWLERVRTALKSGSVSTLHTLKSLLSEGDELPVTMDELSVLQAEVSARDWTERVLSSLAKPASLDELEALANEADALKENLSAIKNAEWKQQEEHELQETISLAKKWIQDAVDILGPEASKYFNALAVLSSPNPRSTHTSKKSFMALFEHLQLSTRISADLSAYTQPLDLLVDRCRKIDAEIASVLVTINNQRMVHEKNFVPNGSVDHSVTGSTYPACVSLLSQAEDLPVIIEAGVQLKTCIDATNQWLKDVHLICPLRNGRRKRSSNFQGKREMNELNKLMKQGRSLPFRFDDEMGMLQTEIQAVETFQEKSKKFLQSFVRHTREAVQRLVQNEEVYFRQLVENRRNFQTPSFATSCPSIPDEAIMTKKSVSVPAATPIRMDTKRVHSMNHTAIPMPHSKSNGTSKNNMLLDPSLFDDVPVNGNFIDEDLLLSMIQETSGFTSTAGSEAAAKNMNETKEILKRHVNAIDAALQSLDYHSIQSHDEKRKSLMARASSCNPLIDKAWVQLLEWFEKINDMVVQSSVLSVATLEDRALSILSGIAKWIGQVRNSLTLRSSSKSDGKALIQEGDTLWQSLLELHAESPLTSKPSMDHLDLNYLLWYLPYLKKEFSFVEDWESSVRRIWGKLNSTEPFHGTNSGDESAMQLELLQQEQPLKIPPFYCTVQMARTWLAESRWFLFEPDEVRTIQQEMKKAKSWCNRMKKLIAQAMENSHAKDGCGRIKRVAFENLMEGDGSKVCIGVDVLMDMRAVYANSMQWERNVRQSGIEEGTARTEHLRRLLAEYHRPNFLIDHEKFAQVLVSATERYCLCQGPYEGFMIGCDGCHGWYHDTCVGITQHQAENVKDYVCPPCGIIKEVRSAIETLNEVFKRNHSIAELHTHHEKLQFSIGRKLRKEKKELEKAEETVLEMEQKIVTYDKHIIFLEEEKRRRLLSDNSRVDALDAPTLAPAESTNDTAPNVEVTADSTSLVCPVGPNEKTDEAHSNAPNATLSMKLDSILSSSLEGLVKGIEEMKTELETARTTRASAYQDQINSRAKFAATEDALNKAVAAFEKAVALNPSVQTWLAEVQSLLKEMNMDVEFTSCSGNLPKGFTQLMENAQTMGIDDIEDVKTVERILRTFAWSNRLLFQVKRRPHEKILREVIDRASSVFLKDPKAVQPFRNILARASAWNSKAEKVISMASVGAKDFEKVKSLVDTGLRFPLTLELVEKLESIQKRLSTPTKRRADSFSNDTTLDETKPLPKKKRPRKGKAGNAIEPSGSKDSSLL